MASEALSAVLAAAKILHATVQQVKANKRQAHLLADRVAAIVEPVHAFNDTRLAQRETQTALAQLLAVIQDASAFVRDFQDTGRLKRVLFKTNHTERFAELNTRLSHAAQGLTLGTVLAMHAELSGMAASAEDARAQALDRVQDKSVLGVWAIAPTAATFVGRDAELARLDALLNPPPSARSPAMRVAISGMGGTGKSTLAQRATSVLADRFTSGWILDGSHREALLSSLSNVAADLVLGEMQLGQVPRAVRASLSQPDRGGWLMIVDNVDDPAFAHDLPSLLPNLGGCVLVTSRLAHWERDGWGMLRLDLLAPAEAVRLLAGGGTAEDPALPRVAERLGGLALALGQATTYVRRTRLSWTTYLGKLDQQLSQMMPSLQLSIEAALKERPDCELVLQMLQVLHPDNIPRVVLADAFKALNATSDVDDLLAVLADLSIVTSLSETTLSLHRLMRQAIQQAVPSNPQAVEQLGLALADSVGRDAELDPNPQLVAMLPAQFSELLPTLLRVPASDAVIIATRQAMGSVSVFTVGDIAGGVEQWKIAFEVAIAVLPPTDPRLLRSYFVLCIGTITQGLYRDGLALARAMQDHLQRHNVPQTSPFGALAAYALGEAWFYLQRYGEARRLINLGSEALAAALGPTSPIVLTSRVYCAASADGERDWRTSKPIYEQVLGPLEKRYGRAHLFTAAIYIQMAASTCGLGDLQRGLELADLGRDSLEAFCGLSSNLAVHDVCVLADVLGRCGLAQRQRALGEALLEFCRASPSFGPGHLETGRIMSFLSDAYGNLGLADKQRDAAEGALAILAEWVPVEESEHVVRATASLGMAAGAHGDVAGRRAHLEEALRLCTALIGPDHVDTATLAVDVALAAGAAGDRDRQRALLSRARPILETGFPLAPPGGAHPSLAKALAAEADLVLHSNADDVDRAVALLERALAMYEGTYGATHPAVAHVLVALADAEGLRPERRAGVVRACEIYDVHYGAEHSISKIARSKLM